MNIGNGSLGFVQTLNNDDFKKKLRDSMQGVNDFSAKSFVSMDHLQIKASDLAKGIGAVFTVGAATNFIQEMVKVRGEFEQTEIAFKTMLGSQEKSTKLMGEMVELAKNTPMQFSEVSQGAKQLLAYQVEAEKLTETLTMLGNISSGLSVPISRLILVYGQVRAKGKLMGDDLRQFTEAGVPMIAAIAKNMGIAQSEVANLVSEGKVGFKDVEKVLQDLTSQGGLFFNMMEEQSKTIPGQIAKLQDELEQMFNQLGKDAEPIVEDVTAGASLIVENYKEIGSALIDLIAIYGSYKTAVIAVSLIESARAKTVASELGALSFKEKLQLARLNRTKQEALQNLELAKSEAVNQQAILNTMRSEVSALAVKKQKATILATEKSQILSNAKAELDAANLKIQSALSEAETLRYSSVQKKISIEQTKLQVAQDKLSTSNRAALNSAELQRKLINDAKIAQQEVLINQSKLNIALQNNESDATIRNIQTQLTASQVNYKSIQADISIANAKKIKLIAIAQERLANVEYAKSSLAAAQAELSSITSTSTAREVKIAQKNVERAQNKVIATQEQAELARKNALAQSQGFYNAQQNLENQAKKTKIAQGAIANAQETVEVATKNLNSVATARLTLMQNYQLLKTKALAGAQALLNATMLSNPVVAITATVLALVYAYNKLATEMSSTEKAQKTLSDLNLEAEKNIIKEKVALDELLKVAKDEKKSKDDRSKAIQELNKLSPEYLGQLNLENINTQQATRATDAYTESIFKNAKAMAYRSKLEELYKLELEQQDAMKNGPKRNAFEKGGDVVFGLLGFSKEEIKNETDVARSVVNAFGKDILKDKAKFNAEYQKALKFYGFTDLLDTKHQIQAIKKEIEKDSLDAKKTVNEVVEDSFSGKTIKNQPYWEEQLKNAKETFGNALPNSKEWTEARKKIDEANKALEAWNVSTKKATTPKTKTTVTKKADDPLEIFKKEVDQYKEQYDKLAKYAGLKDLAFVEETAKLKIILSGKGATYLDFLKKQQEQLRESAKTSEIAQKKLSVINAEVYSLLEENGFETFKTDFDKQLEDAEYLIDKIKLINDEKAKLEGNTDQGSIDRLKFLNEKDNQNQLNVDRYLKDEGKKFDEQYQYLKVMREAYDADMLLLQDKYNKASNDAEKQRFQGLMALRSSQYNEDTNGKFESAEVNQILEEFKTLEQKKLDIASLYDGKKAKLRAEINSTTTEDELKLLTDTISEIEKKQTEALNAIDKEILEKSEGWVQIFGDYANKTSSEILNIMSSIRSILNDPNNNLPPEQLKAYQDQLEKLKDFISKEDPFAYLYDTFTNFQDLFKDGQFSFDALRLKIEQLKASADGIFNIAEGLGINISEASKDAVKLGLDLFQAGTNIAQGIMTGKPLEVVKGVVQGITSIINAGDRKKERQIQKYKQAVNELTKAFNQLQIAADKALGGDVYKNQKKMIENLNQQNAEIDKMIQKEKDKKKTDKGKIEEWEQQKLDNIQKSKDIMEDISQNILQTNAKDLASTLGDALVEAFSKGEDAAKSFEKVANDVLKNAVLNQLKTQFLETQLQPILDDLEAQMGVTEDGWSGLTPAQQQELRDRIKAVSENFSGSLEAYADLFKDLGDEAEANSLSGAIKAMSEETASLIAGQMNAIRIMQAEGLEIHRNSNNVLIQQLDQLFRIEFNTRSITPMLERIHDVLNTESSRGWGH